MYPYEDKSRNFLEITSRQREDVTNNCRNLYVLDFDTSQFNNVEDVTKFPTTEIKSSLLSSKPSV